MMSDNEEDIRRRDKGKGRAIPDGETVNTSFMTQAAVFFPEDQLSLSQQLRPPTPGSSSAVNEEDYHNDFISNPASESTSTCYGESADADPDRLTKKVNSWVWSLME